MKLIVPIPSESGWVAGSADELGMILGIGAGALALEREVQNMFAGKADKALSRMKVGQEIGESGFRAHWGEFKDGDYHVVGSEAWIDCALDFNCSLLQSAQIYQQGNDPEQIELYPAGELILEPRARDHKHWRESWQSHGGSVGKNGRRFALKNHPVWLAMSPFNHRHPPYAFQSWLSTQEISSLEAKESGWSPPSWRVSALLCPGCV